MGAPEDEIKAAVARELALYTPGALTLFEVGLCQGQVRADIVSLSAWASAGTSSTRAETSACTPP